MGFVTVPISRANLIRECLNEIRLWPGCETVQEIGVLIKRRTFSVRVIGYGAANKRLAERALRCIEREKRRCYHVTPD